MMDIEKYLSYLRSVRNLSEQTIHSYRSDLEAFSGWLVSRGEELEEIWRGELGRLDGPIPEEAPRRLASRFRIDPVRIREIVTAALEGDGDGHDAERRIVQLKSSMKIGSLNMYLKSYDSGRRETLLSAFSPRAPEIY